MRRRTRASDGCTVQLRQRFENSAFGVTVEGWDLVPLDSVAKRGTGHTPDKKHPEYWGGPIKWISLKDSDQLDRLYISETAESITQAGIDNSSAVIHPPGTVVLSRDAGVGKSAITTDKMSVSQHFMAWQCGPRLNNHYLYYWLQSRKREFERIAVGNTIKTIGVPYFRDLCIPLPPLSLQQEIATSLADVDALVFALERLTVKKRDVKRAMMRRLLTDEQRLPLFSDEWSTASLNDVSLRLTGYWGADEPSRTNSIAVSVVRAGDIDENGALSGTASRFFSSGEYANAHCVPGDVLITSSGNGLGKTWLYDGSAGICASNFVRIIRPNRASAFGPFLYYTLRGARARAQLQEHTATSAYPNLLPTFYAERWISLPPLDEQRAIAAVLADMDAELAALDQRLTKTRAVKQAMMQELLTGRTRLVTS